MASAYYVTHKTWLARDTISYSGKMFLRDFKIIALDKYVAFAVFQVLICYSHSCFATKHIANKCL